MAITMYNYIALLVIPSIIIVITYLIRHRNKNVVPTNWPIIGMLPALIKNAGRIHDYATEVLEASGGTFEFKGPWFADMDMLITSDPANVNHILTKNFNNYPKGPRFRKIFDILGEGIFAVDSELWQMHRRTTVSILNHSQFHILLEKNVWNKLENGLFPVLDSYSETGEYFDLQLVFQRFTFDLIVLLLLEIDPETLSVKKFSNNSGNDNKLEKAFKDVTDVVLYRHVFPESYWKLQKWLGIGREKKFTQAWSVFDQFLYPIIMQKQDELVKSGDDESAGLSVFTSYNKVQYQEMTSSSSLQFLRDTFLNLIFAGRDTTSVTLTWLFWNLAKNPSVESTIRDKITTLAKNDNDDDEKNHKLLLKVEECRKLVYLHGAVCETLRLFPSVPLNHKVPSDVDELPSGHVVKPNTKVILSFYSTGRMRGTWGEDVEEFKPERWISTAEKGGGIVHVAAYKFPAFNAGPRSCVGKDMSFNVIKMAAAAIIYRYNFELMEDHPVVPRDSVVLEAKHGLMIKVVKKT